MLNREGSWHSEGESIVYFRSPCHLVHSGRKSRTEKLDLFRSKMTHTWNVNNSSVRTFTKIYFFSLINSLVKDYNIWNSSGLIMIWCGFARISFYIIWSIFVYNFLFDPTYTEVLSLLLEKSPPSPLQYLQWLYSLLSLKMFQEILFNLTWLQQWVLENELRQKLGFNNNWCQELNSNVIFYYCF